jgi:hypothetical protein
MFVREVVRRRAGGERLLLRGALVVWGIDGPLVGV